MTPVPKRWPYLNHTKLSQAFVKLLSGCSVLRGHSCRKLYRSDVRLKTFFFTKLTHANPFKVNAVFFFFLPMSFFIIPAAELPMLNLPEFRMFMAICRTQTSGVRLNVTLYIPYVQWHRSYLEPTTYFSYYILKRHRDVIEGHFTG